MEEDKEIPLILGRPFSATGRALIDVQEGKLLLRVQDETITFNVFEAMKFQSESDSCFSVDVVDKLVVESIKENSPQLPLEACIAKSKTTEVDDSASNECARLLEALQLIDESQDFDFQKENEKEKNEEPLKLEFKPLPSHLKYVYLGDSETFPVIISSGLSKLEEEQLIRVLREHRLAIGWTISDIRGISPSFCMHKILMEEDIKPRVQPQWRLNPSIKEVVRKEVVKLLERGLFILFSTVHG